MATESYQISKRIIFIMEHGRTDIFQAKVSLKYLITASITVSFSGTINLATDTNKFIMVTFIKASILTISLMEQELTYGKTVIITTDNSKKDIVRAKENGSRQEEIFIMEISSRTLKTAWGFTNRMAKLLMQASMLRVNFIKS